MAGGLSFSAIVEYVFKVGGVVNEAICLSICPCPCTRKVQSNGDYTLCFIKLGPPCIFAITFSNVDPFE